MARERGNPSLRWLDRNAGVPLLAVAGALRPGHRLPERIDRIGVLKLTAIGDTVLLSGPIADLGAAFPDAEIVMFAGPQNVAAARLLRGPTRVVTLPTTRPHAAVGQLRRERLDVMVDFGPWSRLEAAYAALSGATFTVGFRTSGQFRHFCQDATVDHAADVHEVQNYRRLVGALGIDSKTPPRLDPPGVVDSSRLPEGDYVVLHPWPSGCRPELKEWPAERWSQLTARLADAGLALVLSGSPADAARSGELARRCPVPVHDLAGQLNLAELVDVAVRSACVVSVNTGVMHLAAAAGAPTVGLHGPTSATRWGPVGPRAVAVTSTFEGCGYLHLGGEFRGRRTDCMLGIEVDAVFDAAIGLMEADRSGEGRAVLTHG